MSSVACIHCDRHITHTHKQMHAITHTCECKTPTDSFTGFFHTGAEHLTIPKWLHHKTDTTKSCHVTSQQQGVRPEQLDQEETGNITTAAGEDHKYACSATKSDIWFSQTNVC